MGAGVTGLVTAAQAARAGLSVIVLEARTAGAATTGNRAPGVAAESQPAVTYCPLHGSRFTPDGHVLEGPATQPPLSPL